MFLVGVLLGGMAFYGTRNEKKEYSSHTLINTGLVSGYNLKSSEGSRIDYAYTNNEMENLISLATSYETQEELAMRLLAKYIILDEPDPELISLEGWEDMKLEDVDTVRKIVKVPGDFEKTLENIMMYSRSREENPVQALLYGKHGFFGIEQIQTLSVNREGNSDQLRFKYTTTDAAVCRYTLIEMTEIFIRKHKHMKTVQSTDVLEFFKKATDDAQDNLDRREEGLLQFMINNKIINYYEQTRYIAAKKEDLDEMYFKELMSLAGADSTLQRLEREMASHVSMPELNSRLVMKRDELSKLNTRIAEFELFNLDSFPADQKAVQQMKSRTEELKDDIRDMANATFVVHRTKEGVELKNILTQWLNQVIDIEKAVARLGVLKKRKEEFEVIYSKFAPWGSRLKRMEREIDVAERAYLENLHSYNQARLHQYNMMMSANLKVVDKPFMPLSAAASKRMMLVIVAFVAGAFLVLAGAVALEMLDNTLKNPVRASRIIGLDIAGAFPKFPPGSRKESINYAYIRERSLGQLLQQIKLHMRERENPDGKPRRIALMSTRAGEGKSYLSQMAVVKLRLSGEKVAYIFPKGGLEEKHGDDFAYDVDIHFFEKKTEARLLKKDDFEPEVYDFIFLELPGLLTETYPVDLLAKYDLSLLFARANRSWNHADTKTLATYSQGITSKPKLVINALKPEALEDSLGEIPKRRSKLRKWVKRAILFDLKSKSTM